MTRLIAMLVIAVSSFVAHAQDFPLSTMPTYAELRAVLLERGWTPDKAYGDEASYGYAEVMCGAHACLAQWLGKNSKPLTITLWRDDADALRVAPQTTSEEE